MQTPSLNLFFKYIYIDSYIGVFAELHRRDCVPALTKTCPFFPPSALKFDIQGNHMCVTIGLKYKRRDAFPNNVNTKTLKIKKIKKTGGKGTRSCAFFIFHCML